MSYLSYTVESASLVSVPPHSEILTASYQSAGTQSKCLTHIVVPPEQPRYITLPTSSHITPPIKAPAIDVSIYSALSTGSGLPPTSRHLTLKAIVPYI